MLCRLKKFRLKITIMLKKSKNFIFDHKIIAIITLLVLCGAGYYTYTKLTSTTGVTRYVFGTAKKGMLITSVSGSGQVSPESQVDLKPKASGEVISISAKAGTKVSAGTIIARLDNSSVLSNVRDAKIGLESAQLSYEKYSVQNSQDKLSANLIKAYDSGYSAVSSTYLDIPNVLSGLEDMFTNDALSQNAARIAGGTRGIEYRDKTESKFYEAQTAVRTVTRNYQGLDRNSSQATIDNALSETYKAVRILSDAVKTRKDFVDYLYDESGKSSTYAPLQTTLGQYSSTVNSHMSALLSSITSISDAKSAFGDTALGTKSSSLSIKEKQNSLRDAQDKLEDYVVRAPFDGVIAKVDAKVGDSASLSTVIATLISKQKIAEVSLNEVDVAQVKVGQKATLTFDAVSDLTISGEVAEIDLIGTVSQGVVTYNVKIAFDTQDDRVKPNMSVSSTIITDTKTDVLLVPNSAIKGTNGTSYVEVYTGETVAEAATSTAKGVMIVGSPERKSVEIGLSNDDETEIISGLVEGEKIITRTIQSSASAATKTTTKTTGLGGGGGMPRF